MWSKLVTFILGLNLSVVVFVLGYTIFCQRFEKIQLKILLSLLLHMQIRKKYKKMVIIREIGIIHVLGIA